MIERLLRWLLPERKEVLGISRDCLDFIMATAENSHPNEFIALLQAKDAQKLGIDEDGVIITDIAFAPGTKTNETSATFQRESMPIGLNYVGVVHSHPNGVLQPSQTDLNSGLSGGRVHIIVGAPYDMNSWKAFKPGGEERNLNTYSVMHDD